MNCGKIALAAALMISPIIANAESTIAQPVKTILYNANADFQYFVGNAGWGAAGCPSAYYAQIPASIPGRDKLLSIVLTAYALGKNVQFQGSCNANANYFDAYYVIVSD